MIYEYETWTPVEDVDLNLGYLIYANVIKEDAEPLSDTKEAYLPEDYVNVVYYKRYSDQELEHSESTTIHELYEMLLALEQSYDQAICELYELLIGGDNGTDGDS